MKARQLPLLVLLLVTVSACTQNDTVSSEMMLAQMPLEKVQNTDQAVEAIERKLIKEGNIEFETDDLTHTREQITQSVSKYKGYIASDQELKSPDRISQTITVRVPADRFDPMLSEATEGISKFDRKEINIRDVTEEFVDIEARLKTKKELEARLRELLKQARTVTDIMEIETQLGNLRADIESIEGRLKYLSSQVSFSTLSITFYQTTPKSTAFGKKLSEGITNGWSNLVWFFVGLVNIWPFLLVAIVLVIWLRAYRRKKS